MTKGSRSYRLFLGVHHFPPLCSDGLVKYTYNAAFVLQQKLQLFDKLRSCLPNRILFLLRLKHFTPILQLLKLSCEVVLGSTVRQTHRLKGSLLGAFSCGNSKTNLVQFLLYKNIFKSRSKQFVLN